jgi:4-amino-4-deoxy-L-arabinose transferase-like glycosyltransferase
MRQVTQKPQLKDGARRWAPLLALALLALALRVHRLAGPSLHGDEAFSAQFVAKPWAEVLCALGDYEPNPPLYYLFLKPWVGLAGDGEFSLRFVSAWWGVPIVPLIYQLGRALKGHWLGATAALLAAINPFLVWHSQEARMYAPLATLALASVALLIRALKTRQPASRWAWAAAAWLALLTHYFAAFLILAQVLILLVVRLRSAAGDGHPARLRAWGPPLLAVGLFYLPWAAYVAPAMLGHEKSWIGSVGLGEFAGRLFVTYSLGSTVSPGQTRWLWPGFLLVAAVGSLAVARWRGWKAAAVTLGLLVPPAAVFLLSLLRPMFHERYLIFVLPLYLILLAAGSIAWAGWMSERRGPPAAVLAAAPLAFLLAASGLSLANYFYVPEHAKSPPWRELVQHVQAQRRPGDAVIQNYPDPSLTYYLPGDLPYALVPQHAPAGEAAIESALAGLTGEHRRLWLVPTQSPDWDATNLVQTWLDRHADLLDRQRFRDLRLRLYLSPSAFLATGESLARLGETVHLKGYRLSPEEGPITPGATLGLSLYWQTEAPLAAGYKVFVHLIDPAGQIAVQRDNPPVGESYPTTAWRPGEVIVDRHDLLIPVDAPPGVYRLAVGLYDGATLDRLPVQGLACEGCSVPAFVSDDRLFLPVEIEIGGAGP